jgi:hypothetical protein
MTRREAFALKSPRSQQSGRAPVARLDRGHDPVKTHAAGSLRREDEVQDQPQAFGDEPATGRGSQASLPMAADSKRPRTTSLTLTLPTMSWPPSRLSAWTRNLRRARDCGGDCLARSSGSTRLHRTSRWHDCSSARRCGATSGSPAAATQTRSARPRELPAQRTTLPRSTMCSGAARIPMSSRGSAW